jgi:hypothetical protein
MRSQAAMCGRKSDLDTQGPGDTAHVVAGGYVRRMAEVRHEVWMQVR